MARLPRLALPGHAHLVIQRGHSGQAVFLDDVDRLAFLAALRESAAGAGTSVHAWALLDNEVLLLLTPPDAAGLSRLMQALGRRYVSAHHRRHGGSGTLWDGRFRAAVVEPGATRLAALCWVDAAALPAVDAVADASPRSSAAQRLGGPRDGSLVDPPELWALGNTPFEREAAYRRLLTQGLPAAEAAALRQAALGGWAVGSPVFAAEVATALARPARPRPRGRPRNTAPR
jgi:putative transposase